MLTLGQQPQRVCSCVREAEFEQLGQWCEGARRDHVEATAAKRFDAVITDGDVWQTEVIDNSLQKAAFLTRCFDQCNSVIRQYCDNNSGEASASTHIEPSRGTLWRKFDELCRIGKVPLPELLERRPPDEIHSALPVDQQLRISVEKQLCSTWNIEVAQKLLAAGQGAGTT